MGASCSSSSAGTHEIIVTTGDKKGAGADDLDVSVTICNSGQWKKKRESVLAKKNTD